MEKHQTKNNIIDRLGLMIAGTIIIALGKLGLIAGTIIIAMVVAAFITFPMAIFAPWFGILFPSGLIYTIRVILAITGQNVMPGKHTSDNSYILGWLIYFGISILAIATKKRVNFFIIYTILIVLLIANIAGCQATIDPNLGHSW
jgi:hypothetical protein